jgi:hypothetical protein
VTLKLARFGALPAMPRRPTARSSACCSSPANAAAKWRACPGAEISDDLAIWTLPGERTKNGATHTVPLSAPARDLLRALLPDHANKRCANGGLLLPGAVGTACRGSLGAVLVCCLLSETKLGRLSPIFEKSIVGIDGKGERDACQTDDEWGDWLGTGRVAHGGQRSFKEAPAFVRRLGLKSSNEWLDYCKSGKRPGDIPSNPYKTYAEAGWAGMGDWLRTGKR